MRADKMRVELYFITLMHSTFKERRGLSATSTTHVCQVPPPKHCLFCAAIFLIYESAPKPMAKAKRSIMKRSWRRRLILRSVIEVITGSSGAQTIEDVMAEGTGLEPASTFVR